MKSQSRLHPILFALLTLMFLGAGCGGGGGMAGAPPPDAMRSTAMAASAEPTAAVAGDATSITW